MRFSLSNLGAALPDFIIASGYLITWIAPYTLQQKMIAYLLLVMLMEFIIIHSSAFMGIVVFDVARTTLQKVWLLLGFGVLYASFAAGFVAAFDAWWPLWTILALTVNRISAIFLGHAPDDDKQRRVKKGWVTSVLAYVLLAFLTTLAPLPSFGITEDVVRLQDLPGGGIWIDEPHRVIAFGFLYFLVTGVSELFGHAWLPDTAMP